MAATTRKLTTVFAADVQGYSRLMEHDEEGTLATLKQYRDAMGRLIEAHNGRVVNTWGDAVIAEFGSVVEAVRAGIDVQNELAQRNAGRPQEARMLFRIGINLGDVIVDGDDLYGDGVNIAARLQSEAEPGGILISNTVYEQVRNKIAVSFDFLGDLRVKNIEERVPSYSVRVGDAPVRPRQASQTAEPRHVPEPLAWGRDAPPPSTAQPGGLGPRRTIGALALAAAIVTAVNLMSWTGEFWAAWPLLGLAVIAGGLLIRRTSRIPKPLAGLAGAALVVTAINLFTWSGEFWAKWPLLGIAIAMAASMLREGSARGRPRQP